MRKIKILIVEDSLQDLTLTQRILKKSEFAFDVFHVDTPEKFREAFSPEWDVILSDYHLGRFTAEDVLAAVKESRFGVPVIVISGALGEEAAVSLMRSGASDYLLKDNLHRLPLIIERVVKESDERKSRRQAELQLREAQQSLQWLVNEIRDHGIFMMTPEGIIQSWNPGAEHITGYSAGEMVGQDFRLLYVPEDRSLKKPEYDLLCASREKTYEEDGVRVRKDGTTFWANEVVTALTDEQGELRGYSKIIRDITEKRQEFLKLKESEQNFRLIVDAIPQKIWSTRRDGRHDYFNKRWYDYVGRDHDLGDTKSWTQAVHPEDLSLVQAKWLMSLKSGEPFEAECRLKHHSSQYRWALARALPIRAPRGGIERWIGTCTDIHEQKVAQAELEKAKLAAESASRMKSSFLANMSHEIRTPLGAILGFTELLKDSSLSEEEKSNFLEIITRNGTQLTSIINDILDLSKIESGSITLELLPSSPHAVISETLSLLEIKAREKNLYLKTRFSDSVPRVIRTDPTRLKQVLLNIVGNAIKFTPSGGIDVQVTSQLSPDSPCRLKILVTDSGIGLSHEQQSKLFKAFSQADESVTRKFGGTGLGLALSKRLAELLGGDIRLQKSEPGQGCVFEIEIADLPAQNENSNSPSASPSEKLTIGTSIPSGSHSRGELGGR